MFYAADNLVQQELSMPKLRDPKDTASRIYNKGTPDAPRYYADFRDLRDVGGKLQALIPSGDVGATGDYTVAHALVQQRLAALTAVRALRPDAVRGRTTLYAFADHHLVRQAQHRAAEPQWLASTQLHLTRAVTFFGPHTDVSAIDVARCTAYRDHLLSLPNGRGDTMSAQTVQHHMNSLSLLFNRAIAEQLLPPGHNPVGLIFDKLKSDATPTMWLEHDEMSVLLRAARALTPERKDLAAVYWYELVAFYAYTGARETEALGLEVTDIDFDREIVRLHPSDWRRLKTKSSSRPVPLFPQLARILKAYLTGPNAPTGRLLFPGLVKDGKEHLLTDFRKVLDKLPVPERLRRDRTELELEKAEAERLDKIARWTDRRRGPKPTETLEELQAPVARTVLDPIRTKMLRHSWCTARLQTLVAGAPITIFQVSQEMGHVDVKQVTERYGHLGVINYRSQHVEFDI
jgi:integrase